MLNEFIEYVREQFGYELTIDRGCKADTFESIFGASFISMEVERN